MSTTRDYDLAVDSQVETFLEMKQKLTYFLVTASVAVIAFDVKFVVDELRSHGRFTTTGLESRLVIFSSLAGLATAGLALLSIHLEHRSHRLHLGYRYARKTWPMLSDRQQAEWTRLNDWGARFLRGAFLFLFAEIGLAVAFFVVLLW